jgi:hypothetical protein
LRNEFGRKDQKKDKKATESDPVIGARPFKRKQRFEIVPNARHEELLFL